MGLYDEFKQNKISAYGVPARIMVIGVGGAGGNTVDHIFELGIKGVNLMICNTDSKALNKSPLEPSQKICMGDGKGAGNDAIVGQQKAKESLAEIRQYVESHNPDLIFLTAGMGGGTGTGAAPVIAQMIHALNIPTIAILTTPSENEGIHRFEQAMVGIRSMRELVDTFIIIKNETIIELSEERSVHEAFNMANDIVAYASKGIAEIALTQSDLVSVDISDVCKVVRNSRYAVMGMASESGEDRVIKAIKSAVLSPLFGNVPIKGSKEVLVNFATSDPSKLKMKEVNKALDYIQSISAGEDENGDKIRVNIIWGTSIKPELEDKIEIIIVVAGFHANAYYSETFGGRLDLDDEKRTIAQAATAVQTPAEVAVEAAPVVKEPITEPEPAPEVVIEPAKLIEPTAPVAPTTPQSPVEPVLVKKIEPTPAPVPTPTAPVTPSQPNVAPVTQPTQPTPQPKVVTPQPAPVQPQPVVVEETANEPWRAEVPARKEVRQIPPQVLPTSYKLDSKTPAYKSRRGMTLMNAVSGKKIIIKMDGSKSQTVETPSDSVQQSLDF